MVRLVRLQMLRKLRDASGNARDLVLARAHVALVALVLLRAGEARVVGSLRPAANQAEKKEKKKRKDGRGCRNDDDDDDDDDARRRRSAAASARVKETESSAEEGPRFEWHGGRANEAFGWGGRESLHASLFPRGVPPRGAVAASPRRRDRAGAHSRRGGRRRPGRHESSRRRPHNL